MTQQSKDTIENPASQLTDSEIEASEKGWVPKSEWEGNSDQWRPAKEFLDRGELMDRISSQSRQLDRNNSEISTLKETMDALALHNKKIGEQEYKNAMSDLKEKKSMALDVMDHDAVVTIDEQMLDLKETKKEIDQFEKQSESQEPTDIIHPEVEQWMNNNSWYNTDIVMQGAADAIAKQYMSKDPSLEANPGALLELVAEQVIKEFPDRLGGQTTKRRKPSGTTETSSTGATRSKGKSTRNSINALTHEQRDIAKRFAAQGVMTEQEYVDQLVALGEVE
jgi:hypothetical protein